MCAKGDNRFVPAARTDEKARIGRRIAQARKEAGLTQRELADQVGVTLRSVQAWERGEAHPYRHLPVLQRVLGRDAEWLVGGPSADSAEKQPATIRLNVRRAEQVLDTGDDRELSERELPRPDRHRRETLGRLERLEARLAQLEEAVRLLGEPEDRPHHAEP